MSLAICIGEISEILLEKMIALNRVKVIKAHRVSLCLIKMDLMECT